MEQFLIDTSCISDYLSASMPKKGMEYMDKVIDAGPKISIITQIELLCWNTPDARKIANINNFVSDSIIFEITPDVVMHCVKIRKGKKIKTPDAIIAATALSLGCTLLTNNEKDFKHIPGLKIINPSKL
jgi:predicted nucleic acid-binding protein